MSRLLIFIILLSGTASHMPALAVEVGAPPCDRRSFSTCALASGDAFTVEGNEASGTRPPRDISSGPLRSTSPLLNQSRHVPTCAGNTVGGEDALCAESGETCPEPGQVRFWVFRRTVDTRVPNDDPPFIRDTTPPFVCLEPDAPELDPRTAIQAIVNRDFQRIVVLKGVPEVSPRPDTLVSVDTIFTTSSPSSLRHSADAARSLGRGHRDRVPLDLALR